MASNQASVADYFSKKDDSLSQNRASDKKDENPYKRTRSKLSSVESEASEHLSHRILEELAEIKTELRKNRESFEGMITELREEMNKKVDDMKQKYDEKCGKLRDDYDKLYMENQELRAKIQERKKEMESLEKAVIYTQRNASKALATANRNEQYSRKTNIKIHGIEDVQLENGKIQSTEETVRKVLKEVIQVDLSNDEIVAVHRIPGDQGRVSPILLKVKNTEVKARIMRKRKVFKEKRVGAKLSDDVTKENGKLIRTLLEHKSVEEAWYFNCRVYAKLKGSKERRFLFDINDDIEKKIKKRLSGRQGRLDPASGYATDSDSE